MKSDGDGWIGIQIVHLLSIHLASDRLQQIESYRNTMIAMRLNEFQNGNKDQ